MWLLNWKNEIGSAVVSADSQDGSDLKPYLRHDLFDRGCTRIPESIIHPRNLKSRPVTFRDQNHRVFLGRIKAHPFSVSPFMHREVSHLDSFALHSDKAINRSNSWATLRPSTRTFSLPPAHLANTDTSEKNVFHNMGPIPIPWKVLSPIVKTAEYVPRTITWHLRGDK